MKRTYIVLFLCTIMAFLFYLYRPPSCSIHPFTPAFTVKLDGREEPPAVIVLHDSIPGIDIPGIEVKYAIWPDGYTIWLSLDQKSRQYKEGNISLSELSSLRSNLAGIINPSYHEKSVRSGVIPLTQPLPRSEVHIHFSGLDFCMEVHGWPKSVSQKFCRYYEQIETLIQNSLPEEDSGNPLNEPIWKIVRGKNEYRVGSESNSK